MTCLLSAVATGAWKTLLKRQRLFAVSPDIYLLLHTFPGGESVNTIHYIPTDDAPSPDICAVARLLLKDVYSPESDCIQLIEVSAEPDMEFLPTDNVGTKVFREFHDGSIEAVTTKKRKR